MAGITGTHHHSWLSFVFLVETGFCHVDQAGLEFLTSGSEGTDEICANFCTSDVILSNLNVLSNEPDAVLSNEPDAVLSNEPDAVFSHEPEQDLGNSISSCIPETGSCSVVQAGVQWHVHSLLQCQIPEFKQYSHLCLLSAVAHTCNPSTLGGQ
ncbi:EEF1A lysine methyltransferase 2, partial [Plecturocebus cupreus]